MKYCGKWSALAGNSLLLLSSIAQYASAGPVPSATKPSVAPQPTLAGSEQFCYEKTCGAMCPKPPTKSALAILGPADCKKAPIVATNPTAHKRDIAAPDGDLIDSNDEPLEASQDLERRVLADVPPAQTGAYVQMLSNALDAGNAWTNQIGTVSGHW
jgi:hypothetical protein